MQTHYIEVPASTTVRYQFLTREVYLAHVMSEGTFSTEVYKLVPEASSHMFQIHRVAIFEYPQVRGKDAGPGIFSMSPQYLQGHCLSRNAPPAPFLRAQDPPLIVVHRTYTDTHIMHYIRSSVFTSVAKDFVPSAQPRDSSPVIQWKSWGPQNSRCVVDRDARRSIYRASCFGNQALTPGLEVWDFNQLAFAREYKRAVLERGLDSTTPLPVDEPYWGIFPMRKLTQLFKSSDVDDATLVLDSELPENLVTKPTVICKDPILASDVTTRLPYRKAKLDATGVPDHWLRGGFLGHPCIMQTVLADVSR